MKKLILFLLVFIFFFTSFVFIRAKECNEGDPTLQQICLDINELEKALEMSKAATQPLESELNKLETQIKRIQTAINVANQKIKSLEEDIFNREIELAYQQEVLAARVRSLYKKNRQYSPLLIFLVSSSANDLFRELSYRQTTTQEDKRIIIDVSQDLITLKNDKEKLEENKIALAASQKNLDQQAEFFRTEVAKAKTYQAQLSSKIAELTAKQQSILAAKSGSFIVSVGDSELADDYNASIKGFRESAPTGSFGVFSFGAYTHRNGMSQYGALGRAKNNGWNYEQILKHYYPGVQITKIDTNKTITVYGTNSYKQSFNNENYQLEEYLKHIYEVPASWPVEVLKAQAIAARSYAYNKTSICSGQSCQEFKREENSENWKRAVKDTEGLIMTSGSGSYQYSSTTGGWINGVGWDTTDSGGGSNFIDKTYEKIAGSPWVYKAWYTKTYRNDSDKCGRSNPWLTSEEMADIINAAIYRDERVTPITTSCWGGNPYSHAELREKANGYSSVYSVSVIQGNGLTSEVIFQTDKGEVKLSGSDFKTAFNLRAPGYVSIPQKDFWFFNIEKK